jgi:hypothetical protein
MLLLSLSGYLLYEINFLNQLYSLLFLGSCLSLVSDLYSYVT